MARRVRWTTPAWEDLTEAAEHISRDSKFYAATFVREARDASRSLARFAERGRVVPEVGDESIRELFVSSYRLVYRLTTTEVQILALIHHARDFQRVFSDRT